MFELGMRLAFDKPTIIVKDDKTNYSFDTSPIEHIPYPRDLRFSKIVEFKKKLTDKILSTSKMSSDDKNYTTFLKHFGEFTVAKLDKKEISGQEYIIEELRLLRQTIAERDTENRILSKNSSSSIRRARAPIDICLNGLTSDSVSKLEDYISTFPGISDINKLKLDEGHFHLTANLTSFDLGRRESLREKAISFKRKLKSSQSAQ